jgi:surfactin synthase thioesterase subunit
MDLIKGFFKGEYATDTQLTAATDLREDLWLDFLALEELGEYLRATVPTFKADWDSVRTLGDLAKLLPASHAAPVAAVAVAPVAVPQRGPEALKLWFPVVIDRFKEKRQQDPAAVPLIGFYHAGGAVANLRPFAKELDAVMGSVAVNPMFVELPGRGVRGKDALLLSCRESSREIAAVVASQVLGGDRRRKFAVFGHSVGTLHAFEVTRELERLGFVPRALVVLNRQAPQIAMDRPEDNFGPPLTDEQFIAKMSSEYNQKALSDLWKTHPEIVKGESFFRFAL